MQVNTQSKKKPITQRNYIRSQWHSLKLRRDQKIQLFITMKLLI